MNSTLVIARRELTERRFVFVAAIAFALLSVILPWMPFIRAGARREAVVVLSSLLAINFVLGLAGALGGTIIGRELSEGRLSFYFSKPVPAPSIWFGKLIAALLLIVVSFGIIGLPAFLAGAEKIVNVWTNPPRKPLLVALVFLAVAAAVFLVTHVIGTLIRSRSPWIVFDFIAATICGTAIWLLARTLLSGFAVELTKHAGVVFAAYAALVIVGAGAWQITRGRTDRRQSHIELSRFLWIGVGSGLLLAAAFVAWVASAGVADLIPEFAMQSSSSPWAVIRGRTKHRGDYRAAFLYNLSDGRAIRIVSSWGTAFSSDGKTAVWLTPSSAGFQELSIARLDVPHPQPVATGIPFRGGFYNISGDGSRAVMIDRQGILTIYDIGTRSSLGSARVPAGDFWSGTFISRDLLRIYAHMREQLPSEVAPVRVFEYDVAHKSLQQIGEVPLRLLRFGRGGTRAVTRGDAGLEIHDARTGALILTIPPRSNGRFVSARMLGDGRIVAIEDDDGRRVLRFFSAEGTPLHHIDVRGLTDMFLTDLGGGRVVVAAKQANWTSVLLDIDRGVVLRSEPGLRAVINYGSAGPRLLCYSPDGLVVWDTTTGEKRAIVAR